VQVRFQQEFLYDVKADIQRLLQMHWEEIALNKDHIKTQSRLECLRKPRRKWKTKDIYR
jgi:hypothetical protein